MLDAIICSQGNKRCKGKPRNILFATRFVFIISDKRLMIFRALFYKSIFSLTYPETWDLIWWELEIFNKMKLNINVIRFITVFKQKLVNRKEESTINLLNFNKPVTATIRMIQEDQSATRIATTSPLTINIIHENMMKNGGWMVHVKVINEQLILSGWICSWFQKLSVTTPSILLQRTIQPTKVLLSYFPFALFAST